MLKYLKENGFPMTIWIKTEKSEDKKENWKGYESTVTDEHGEVIDTFYHSKISYRTLWVRGFFKRFEKTIKMKAKEIEKDIFENLVDSGDTIDDNFERFYDNHKGIIYRRIIKYAKQKVKERDEQWEAVIEESFEEYNQVIWGKAKYNILKNKLPEPEFE